VRVVAAVAVGGGKLTEKEGEREKEREREKR